MENIVIIIIAIIFLYMLGDYLFGYKNKKAELKPAPTEAEIISLLNQENEKILIDVEFLVFVILVAGLR